MRQELLGCIQQPSQKLCACTFLQAIKHTNCTWAYYTLCKTPGLAPPCVISRQRHIVLPPHELPRHWHAGTVRVNRGSLVQEVYRGIGRVEHDEGAAGDRQVNDVACGGVARVDESKSASVGIEGPELP